MPAIEDSQSNHAERWRLISPPSSSLTLDQIGAGSPNSQSPAHAGLFTTFAHSNDGGAAHYPSDVFNQKIMKNSISRNNFNESVMRTACSIDRIEDSLMFALTKDLRKVDVFKSTEMPSVRKPPRRTFTNIDRMFPQYYRVPPKPSSFDEFDRRGMQAFRPRDRINHEDIFPKKSPMMQLLEINGKVPKFNGRYEPHDLNQTRSVSVPHSRSGNTLLDPKALCGFNPVKPIWPGSVKTGVKRHIETSLRNRDIFELSQ